MVEVLLRLADIQGTLFCILVLIQVAVNFFLPPSKAKRFNFLGRALNALCETKGGCSVRRGDD